MLRQFSDLLLHRVPWDGDRIRLYRRNPDGEVDFLIETYLSIKSGTVHVPPYGYIRRDLPTWSDRWGGWVYTYND